MKKGMKKLIIIGATVGVLIVAYFIYQSISNNAEQDAMFEVVPSADVVTKGDISLSVSGSGNLGSAKTIKIKADSYLVIDEVLVDEGDTITEGQVIAALDTKAMQDHAHELEQEISSLQTSIDTTNNVTTSLSIKSKSDGWVKNVMLDEDEYIQDAMEQYGYIALVATQEREIINAANSDLSEGDSVRVKSEGYWHDGVVTAEKDALYVSIDTIKRTVGADAVVYDLDGNEIFTGQMELAEFEQIESNYGIIDDVEFSEDEEIEQGETIYRASQYSLEVKDLYEDMADKQAEYNAIVSLIESATVSASGAGVVSSVEIEDGQTYEQDALLLSVESTDTWQATVAVDELDINAIAIGQSVEVSLDSIPNEVFVGEVVGISDKGTASGGITTYEVDVSVEDNEGFRLAMTLNCEIMAQEALDAVLAPVDDVRTSRTQSYVMVAVQRTKDETAAIKQMIIDNDLTGLIDYMGDDAVAMGISMLSDTSELLYGEVRAVETGIQNAFYVEIISGLEEGESILAPTSSGDDDTMSFMRDMGGIIMEGSSEGFTRPNGGQGGGRGGF